MSKRITEANLKNLTDANFPKDASGRVYHLAVKKGEVANRILSVGDTKRGKLIASFFDEPDKVFHLQASRGFNTFTGKKNGIPITILTTGMGIPMMDFVIRECRAVVEGPMIFLRLGTCGVVDSNIPIGSICVTKNSTSIRRNPDAWSKPNEVNISPYIFSIPIDSDKELHELYLKNLKKEVTDHLIVETMNATCDSFYSSQGRTTEHFDDKNENLINEYQKKFKEAGTLEMETFHLFDLARCSIQSIKGAAAMIVLAQRKSNDFLDSETTHILEKKGGLAALNTLSEFKLEGTMDDDKDCVWNQE